MFTNTTPQFKDGGSCDECLILDILKTKSGGPKLVLFGGPNWKINSGRTSKWVEGNTYPTCFISSWFRSKRLTRAQTCALIAGPRAKNSVGRMQNAPRISGNQGMLFTDRETAKSATYIQISFVNLTFCLQTQQSGQTNLMPGRSGSHFWQHWTERLST